jgi:hypothetical protein
VAEHERQTRELGGMQVDPSRAARCVNLGRKRTRPGWGRRGRPRRGRAR